MPPLAIGALQGTTETLRYEGAQLVGCGKGAGVPPAVEQEGVDKALERLAEGRLSPFVIAILKCLRGLTEETLGLLLEIS
jgi:hypothetical protein